jgi:uncharacterized protein
MFKKQTYLKRVYEEKIRRALEWSPVVAIIGPRQCGKSTLAKEILKDFSESVYIDLELPSDQRRLEDPELFLGEKESCLVCIDEVQFSPGLFPVLRGLIDQNRAPGRFLLLGSASQDLIRSSTETLAGRIHYIEITPFLYSELLNNPEVRDDSDSIRKRLWLQGGFPPAYLQELKISNQWRLDFIQTFLNRDIPSFGSGIAAPALHRFWRMLSHYHGNVLNASKIAQSLDVSHVTVKRYIDLLEQTFMLRVLRPMEINIKKRLIKAPKVYIRDTGILHSLWEVESFDTLFAHPLFGASWEGWCVEQIISALPGWTPAYYRTSSGEEIDLVMEKSGKRLVFEIKASLSPKVSNGFKRTLNLLEPDQSYIICPLKGEGYPHKSGARICGIGEFLRRHRRVLSAE